VPNYLDTLLQSVEDPELQEALSREIRRLREGKQFGLVFEKHLPETVRLYSHPIRAGLLVQYKTGDDTDTWMVQEVRKGIATLTPARDTGERESGSADEQVEAPTGELVVIREFGDPIYPGLKPVGRIDRGGDKPFHTVINAENYHALETLLYAYEGKIDCIYIDPPYNTGARDWKYNNDYVDANDVFRHSKFLSFVEKRLLVAKRLLNPKGSGLILTIDEKEVHRMGLLLEQVFPTARIQMISSVINPKGVVRDNEFSRTDEYLFFVVLGDLRLVPELDAEAVGAAVPWQQLRRTDIESARGTKKGGKSQFFPIFVNESSGKIEAIGKAIPPQFDRHKVPPREGCVTVFPVRNDGTEMNWGLTGESLQRLVQRGFVRATKFSPDKPQPFTIQYLTSGRVADVDAGKAEVVEFDVSGSAVVRYKDGESQRKMATTAWDRPSHNAQYYGRGTLEALVPDRSFPFPKSLYAVEDALRFIVGNNKEAVVLDFFAGSGTTSHAVMRLNHQDGGHRRSIAVTNNEVGVVDEERLKAQGLLPGDSEWESLGIFQHITKPRIEAAVTGTTHQGLQVRGDYRFGDKFAFSEGLEENVEFLELTYEDRDRISLGRAFEAVAHLLWMKAGSRGPVIDRIPKDEPWAIPEGAVYGVLFDAESWGGFVDAVKDRPDVRSIFVVTNSTSVFQQVASELPDWVEPTMLYEDYLSTFEINTGTGE